MCLSASCLRRIETPDGEASIVRAAGLDLFTTAFLRAADGAHIPQLGDADRDPLAAIDEVLADAVHAEVSGVAQASSSSPEGDLFQDGAGFA